MTEEIKSCDTCAHSYIVQGDVKTQNCGSPDYNSESYTHEMLMEDWDQGYCRFWSPKNEEVYHEKQLFHRRT